MCDIDPDLRDKIIETHTDMRHVRKQLEGGKETFKDHDERLRELEQTQSKIMTYIIAIGSAITIAVNAAIHFIGNIWK
jgi:CO dehydrogenase/acetyl-CoA synthase beta subunit